MALTIREIDKETRKLLDVFKAEKEIKTDSKALIYALHCAVESMDENIILRINKEKLLDEISKYHRILSGLEEYLAPALEIIKQKELDLD